ncbi:monoamine oxidase [Pseudorhodoferax soli]|uniref:Tryptophan 2-monooxygenase n=2 Tax=Pseudorhodoferax soli TaxID=545864 RepID=A0A368XKS2_9BURK|nr:monoamine oxidase [Pseudorhodoferax soli]
MIGKAAGGAAMYQAMTSLGHAAESEYSGPIKLSPAKKGASVVVLGAGLAGMVAALELRSAGYSVKLLEFQNRAGGRCWTLRGGDEFSELDGTRQTVGFAKGNYFNPGPWRVPHHHLAMMDYYKRFGIKLEAFNQVNHNAFVHNSKAFGGKPQRFRHVQADFRGHTSELLAKAANQGALNDAVTREDTEKLLAGLRAWGVLNKDNRYVASERVSDYRGFDVEPGGGLMPLATPSEPIGLHELLQSDLWSQINSGNMYEFQTTLFQPAGGMDALAKALERELKCHMRYNTKVTKIAQSERSVTVHFTDANKPGAQQSVSADWCVCTIPASLLSQMDIQVGDAMRSAIESLPYGSSIKVGLEFKRRFWEDDERIYGGISYTDLPIQMISYPSNDYMKAGPAVLLGAYSFENTDSYRFASLTPNERIRLALAYGGRIHPQYSEEFSNGVSVAWHRIPWTQGCHGVWSESLRKEHYNNLAQVDNRIVLAGEHVSHIPAWQEGSVLSALDAVKRLHAKAINV